jgi:hypothetical protein
MVLDTDDCPTFLVRVTERMLGAARIVDFPFTVVVLDEEPE